MELLSFWTRKVLVIRIRWAVLSRTDKTTANLSSVSILNYIKKKFGWTSYVFWLNIDVLKAVVVVKEVVVVKAVKVILILK